MKIVIAVTGHGLCTLGVTANRPGMPASLSPNCFRATATLLRPYPSSTGSAPWAPGCLSFTATVPNYQSGTGAHLQLLEHVSAVRHGLGAPKPRGVEGGHGPRVELLGRLHRRAARVGGAVQRARAQGLGGSGMPARVGYDGIVSLTYVKVPHRRVPMPWPKRRA